MTRYDTCDTQWLSRQPIMMVVQQLSRLQMVLRNSILASKVNWTQILHVNFPRCFHVFPSFFLKTFVPWCQLYVRRVLRAALAERATAPEVRKSLEVLVPRKSKTWTKITGHMKKHEHIMTWTYCFPNLLIHLRKLFWAREAISCLECHGTGTALGDPIEAGRPVHRAVHPAVSGNVERGRSPESGVRQEPKLLHAGGRKDEFGALGRPGMIWKHGEHETSWNMLSTRPEVHFVILCPSLSTF